MKRLKLESPAKVNLFLNVVGLRPDGYHELASLFQTISLCDTLEFTFSSADHLTCSDPSLPLDRSNLINKAIHLYRHKTEKQFGVHTHLIKRIPTQSGLGGGSSNAATTLWALNLFHDKLVPLATLQEWAAELGSDVPFFLSQGTAYCTGRGEIVQPLSALAPRKMWIIKPRQGLSTPAVYKRLNLTEKLPLNLESILHKNLSGEAIYFNDLEEPAFALFPQLGLLKKQMLELGYSQVLMTGSGSALVCFGDKTPLAGPHIQTYSASFLNRAHDHWY